MAGVIIMAEGMCGVVAAATYASADEADPEVHLRVTDVAFVERSPFQRFGR